MRKPRKSSTTIEILESRIAPAAVPILNAAWIAANSGTSTGTGNATYELHAGQGLSSSGALQGTYFLYVEQGNAVIFTTDINANGTVDYNEITGIAAGDGLRLISFVDIHGDIVTNLKETNVFEAGPGGTVTTRSVLTLSDSDNNATNDLEADGRYRGDGRIVLNNAIEKIELRSLTIADLPDQNGDGQVNQADVDARAAVSTYSVYGNIYAGRGFGAPDGGLLVNMTGFFGRFDHTPRPMVNGIKVGTATSGEYYSFGPSNQNDFQGVLLPFTPLSGAKGASIDGVRAVGDATTLNIGSLLAGNGGVGGPGGDISNVTLATDDTGGYVIVAGNGGRGPSGGSGGSIVNFSDTGSVTGRVLIKTGDGGVGSNGAGGSSGNLTFGTLNVRGEMALELGDGGSGFASGGSGASLTAGRITTPETAETQGLAAFGVTNLADTSGGLYVPRIGIQQAVDFNGDGFGDIVLTTGDAQGDSGSDSRSQLMVALGDGAGGFLPFKGLNTDLTSRGVFLPGLRSPDALTVADINGDGRPDIAVASSDHGQGAGVTTYLSKFVDLNFDGTLSSDEFVGFHDARFSPVTQPNPVQINKLGAGDFDGDGKVELAVVMTEEGPPGLFVQVLGFMQQDYENGKQTGQFYFDFGTKGDPTAVPPIDPVPYDPFLPLSLGDGDTVDLRVTALADGTNGSTASTYDVVLVSFRDTDDPILTVDYSVRWDPVFGALPPEIIGIFALGQVDTDRLPNTPGKTDHQNLVDARVHDFTVADLTGDGNADVGFITSTPSGFFVGIAGDGGGNGTPDSGTGDNAGNFIGPPGRVLVAITSGDFDQSGVTDDLGIAYIVPGPGDAVDHFHYMSGPDGAVFVNGGFTLSDFEDYGDNSSVAFTTFVLDANDITTSTSGAGTEGAIEFAVPAVVPPGVFVFVSSISYTNDNFSFNAGNGGLSLTGTGGNGGFFGGKLNAFPGSGNLFTTNPDLQFVTDVPVGLAAGFGGDGFVSGGKGGNISGVGIEQTPDFIAWAASRLTSGAGGRGVTGVGGAGGDIFDNFVDRGIVYTAGDGGAGSVGGRGGNVVGAGLRGNFDTTASGHGNVPIAGFYDTAADGVTVTAGAGGDGTKAGGAGGSITNFAAGLYSVLVLFPINIIQYVAGDGGDATSGPGGTGGSVTNSSPLVQNYLTGDILVQSGKGGDGLSGGNGGAIVNFVDRPAAGVDRAGIVSFLSGAGGNATAGVGGTGGGISGVSVPTVGHGLPALTKYAFNRMIAGNGGDSSSSNGGTGGSIRDVLTSAQEASYAVVAGEGGNGLYRGGKGGSLINIEVSIGAGPFAQALLIAGGGGNASAFVPNANDTVPDQPRAAFGGEIGVGGDGGDIDGVKQRGASQAHVNLIAGNGGDTIHYGTVFDAKPFVGSGGSISNVDVIGDIGNTTPDSTAAGNQAVPIKSYNDILNGQSVADWVDVKLINNPDLAIISLNDTDGNVGLVVGAAGRNKAVVIDPVNFPDVYRSQPASKAVNGSLTNLTAKNLMSAIAGSVVRIASINVAKGIKVPPGIIGSEKGEIGAGTPNYLDQFGNPTSKNGDVTQGEPDLEGVLIDGALIATRILDLGGNQITLPGKVFPR